MDGTDDSNMVVWEDHSEPLSSSSSLPCISFDFHRLSASSQPHLLGFPCTTNNSLSSSLSSSPHRNYPAHPLFQPGSAIGKVSECDAYMYLSPPPTSSPPGRNVPLPTLQIVERSIATQDVPWYNCQQMGGILDSPVIPLGTLASHIPLSPPPTQPTTTLALPPADGGDTVLSLDIPEVGCSSLGADRERFAKDQTTSHQLLSPLSPEWDSHCIPPPEECGAFHDDWSMVAKDSDEPCSSDSSAASDPSLVPPQTDSSPSFFMNWEPPPTPDSPRLKSLDLLQDDDLDCNLQAFPTEHTPPSSPSLRSFACLPEIGASDDDMCFSPKRPTLLGLPGADTDDDLLPPDDFGPIWDTTPSPPSLLFLDDPPPISGSSSDIDVDEEHFSTFEEQDPDLEKLLALRRSLREKERNAKRLERELPDTSARMDARVVRKREKERCREISDLLRLKRQYLLLSPEQHRGRPGCGGRNLETPKPNPKLKTSVQTMDQLVARMIFRRHDTFRSVPSRVPTMMVARSVDLEKPPRSLLGRAVVAPADNDDDTDVIVDEADDDEDAGLRVLSSFAPLEDD